MTAKKEPEGGPPGDQTGEDSTHIVMQMLASSSNWSFILAVIGSASLSSGSSSPP